MRALGRIAEYTRRRLEGTARPRIGDTAHLRSYRAEYGKTARAGLLLHTGSMLDWIAPDILAAPGGGCSSQDRHRASASITPKRIDRYTAQRWRDFGGNRSRPWSNRRLPQTWLQSQPESQQGSFLRYAIGDDCKGKPSPALHLAAIPPATHVHRVSHAIYSVAARAWLIPDRYVGRVLAGPSQAD